MNHTTTRAMRTTLLMLPVYAAFALGGCATGGLHAKDRQNIAGKTFVITGASSGLGRGVALELAQNGANVVLAARRTAVLEEIAAQARAAGGTSLVVTTDVSNASDVQRLADEAVHRFGRIDVWINNAGIGAIGAFWDIPVNDQAKLIDTNLKGVIYGSYAALRQFRAQGHGTLVNIGSVDSEVPHAYQAAYSASKAGVLSLGRALNEELRLSGEKNIIVATVMPWAIDTPFWTHTANYSGHEPEVPMMDDPQKVVNGIVWTSLHPKEELAVGWKAKAAYAGHHIMPDTTERFTADMARKSEMESGPPAPPTSGALYQPMPAGTAVSGGVRERMKQEDAARAAGSQPGETAERNLQPSGTQ
jgi:short-subunit dehydrogenase